MALWTNPLARHGIYWEAIEKLPEVNAGVNDEMDKIVSAWKENSPVADGDYKKSIVVTRRSISRGRGIVGATAEHAHWVEFGSVHNPEHAPAEKTAKQFGGSAHGKS